MTDQRPCDEQSCEKPRRSLQIGMTAYECIPGLVFVRVPNERGRFMLVDRCVAEVDCRSCGAVAGEPCHDRKPPHSRRYCVGTHTRRREDGDRRGTARKPKPKLRLRASDIEAASMPAE